jgi:hypothetical protein
MGRTVTERKGAAPNIQSAGLRNGGPQTTFVNPPYRVSYQTTPYARIYSDGPLVLETAS